MEWVVTEFGVEADFNIVVTPSVTIENLLHLSAKITLDLQNQTPNPLRRIVSFISQDLFGVGIHAARSLPASHGAQDRDAGEQSALGYNQPVGRFGWTRTSRVVRFSQDDEEIRSCLWLRGPRKTSGDDALANSQGADVERGEQPEIDDVRCGELEHVIECAEAHESLRRSHGDDSQKELVSREGPRIKKRHP